MCLADIFGIIFHFLTLVQDSVEVTGSGRNRRDRDRLKSWESNPGRP